MKQLYAVIGNPISHTLSPLMHNTAFQELEINAHYHAFQIEHDQLGPAVNGLRAIGISGFNVTVPFKSAIIPYLDHVDDLAWRIGAVNTVINDKGKLVGYNTDGMGFVRGLNSLTTLEDKKILIIGAGGAARAIYYTLMNSSVEAVDICNRTISNAEKIIDHNQMKKSKVMNLQDASNNLYKYDLVIQTTTIGMKPNEKDMPIDISNLRENTIVSDIIYNPFETTFLKRAKLRGAVTQNGLDMLVYQGALAFEKWTGYFPNTNIMKKVVMEQLGGTKEC